MKRIANQGRYKLYHSNKFNYFCYMLKKNNFKITSLYAMAVRYGIRGSLGGVVFVLFCLLQTSCRTTRHVPDGSYLLRKNSIKITERRTVTADDVTPYIRQRPNRTSLLNMKFHLWQYNLSSDDTTKWINRRLRSWGEPPVLFDSLLVEKSVDNIQGYMRQRGFYYADVMDTVIYRKKKAEVIYTITPNEPYRINHLSYEIADSTIRAIVYSDTLNSLLRSRRRLSTAILENEQTRITSLLRNHGYYTFNKGYINFEADSSKETMTASIKITITDHTIMDERGRKKQVGHSMYKVKRVYINTNYNAVQAIADSNYIYHPFDTVYQKGLYIVYDDKLRLHSGVLSRVNLIEPNSLFKEEHAVGTHRNLSNLQMFKSVSVQFKDLGEEDEDGYKLLDCMILLDPLAQQTYKVDFEISSNSQDLIGFSPGFRYAHRNMLGGAEIFSLDFRGIFQYSLPAAETYQSSIEYNLTSGIQIPRFLMPVSIPYFKKQIPHTQIASAYIYQRRPEYTRSLANFSYGYSWRGSPNNYFILTPFDFSMVKMWELSKEFYDNLNDPYLQATYEDHLILGLNGSYIYNSLPENIRQTNRRRASFFYRVNADVAGNFLSLFNGLMPRSESLRHNNSHTIFSLPYSQFAKADITLVYTKPLSFPSNNAVAYRAFFGIGKPYGNSISLPFEKMYYAGGANSLRAWPARGVGPGSALPDSGVYVFPNQAADMRIEFNVEYRFPIFWFFEGAFFIDAGNVWSLNPRGSRPGALFRFDSFYKEIAANLGTGLRFNFSYFIFRIDMGTKLYEPALPEGERFIAPKYWLSGRNKGFHFGINYPF